MSKSAAVQRRTAPRAITASPRLRLPWLRVEPVAKIRSDLPIHAPNCACPGNATFGAGMNTTSRWAPQRPPASFHPRLPAPLTIDTSSRSTSLSRIRPFGQSKSGLGFLHAQERKLGEFSRATPKHLHIQKGFRRKPSKAAQESLTGILSACAGYCNNRPAVNVQSAQIPKRIERNRRAIRTWRACVHEE
jgi:hypothetical protein